MRFTTTATCNVFGDPFSKNRLRDSDLACLVDRFLFKLFQIKRVGRTLPSPPFVHNSKPAHNSHSQQLGNSLATALLHKQEYILAQRWTCRTRIVVSLSKYYVFSLMSLTSGRWPVGRLYKSCFGKLLQIVLSAPFLFWTHSATQIIFRQCRDA